MCLEFMMQRLLNQKRLVALAFVAATAVSPAIAPLSAQTPTGSSAGQTAFRVIVQDLANKTDAKSTRWGSKASEMIRDGLSQMSTHTAVPEKEVVAELRKLAQPTNNVDCTTLRQLGARMKAQVVMCGEYTVEGSSYKVSASFYTADEAISYDVLPFAASSEKEAADKIVESFRTYVRQLQMVTNCQSFVLSEQWQEALDKCTEALELNPRSTPSLYYRATALLKLNRPEEALAGYQKLLEISPINQEAMRSAGTVAAQLGKSDLATKYYHDYLELNPGDEQVRLTIANDLNKAGDPVAAAKTLEDGLKGDTTNLPLMGAIGNYWMVAGSNNSKSDATDEQKTVGKTYYMNALKYYEKIQRNIVNAKLDKVSLDNLYRYMMQAYHGVGQTAKALEIAPVAMANDSATAGTYQVIAQLYSLNGKQAEAADALNKAATKDPTLKVGYQMALLSLAGGNLDEIVKYTQRAAAEGATDSQLDDIAIRLISEGNKKSGAAQNAWFNAGKSIGKGPKPDAMVSFYEGMDLYKRGADLIPKKPAVISKSNARTALDLVTRAKPLIAASSAFDEAAASRSQALAGIDQIIEYLKAIIKQ
jgi:tetratricopeptide (TPR) repeat protein